ncbi:MAG: DNA repair protein RadA [Eubacteriales bacterium]|nr:DNA repair protein RadA [Eubacteriales bacterium]
MAKTKTVYTCSDCGYESSRWYGKCPSCGAWNTLEESIVESSAQIKKTNKRPPGTGNEAKPLKDVVDRVESRILSGIEEFDRVLGGGIVEGSMLLLGGEPGIGKSTLLMQTAAKLSLDGKNVLYVSGEESAHQLKMRANRLGASNSDLMVLTENAMDNITEKVLSTQPDILIIDSIQTMYRPEMASAPGSVSQIRECTAILMRLAKQEGISVLIAGHVTKEGSIAGPRVLEHMVDVVLYFEGESRREYRLLRAVKNRFGSVNELGVFEMTEKGMMGVENPSEMLLSQRAKGVSGSVVYCALEGTRPMLVDVQALVTQSFYVSPKRTVNGIDQGRVALLLAVLEKRAGLKLYNQDVYINVAGGMRLNEPASDLAVCLAVASSFRDVPLPNDLAAIGEIGLAGELRNVSQTERRFAECARLGINRIVCPKGRLRGKIQDGITPIFSSSVYEALKLFRLV